MWNHILDANLKQLRQLKNKTFARFLALMNGMPKKQRTAFADAMQRVSEETVRNCADNHISFSSVKGFDYCPVPTLAIAGNREPDDVQRSVRRMAEINRHCEYQLWEKATHNIPPVHYKRFNRTIEAFFNDKEPK